MIEEETRLSLIKELLEIPIAVRSLQNIEKLAELTKDYGFFQTDLLNQQNGERIHQLVCQYMTYLVVNKDQSLFTLGEKGQYFYLILKGKVGMYIQRKDPTNGEIDPYNYDKIKEIPQGYAFGELSLQSDKQSIVLAKCETNCEFAVLTKNRYKNLLQIAGIKFLMSEIGFLNSLPYEKKVKEKLIKLLFTKRQAINFHRGQVVYEEGSQVGDVYLVRSGEFNKMKKIVNKPEEVEQYWQLPPDEIHVNQRSSVKANKKPPKESNVQIGLIQSQSLVGEYEIVNNLKKRQFTLMCYSQEGQLYVFSKKDFEEYMLSEEFDREYLLKRATKICQMEQEILTKNQNGTLYNHFFSFENAYKHNRIQSKSNVLDESPLPYSSKGYSSPRLKLQSSLFTSRKTSLAAEPASSLSNLQLLKQQSIGLIQVPNSPTKKYVYNSYFPSDQENLNQVEHVLQVPSLKEKKNITLENIKMYTPSYISRDSLNSPQSLNTLSPPKRKIKLQLKIKTEQNLDDQHDIQRSYNQKQNELVINQNNKIQQNQNLQSKISQNSLNQISLNQLTIGNASKSYSFSPQKINSYYQSKIVQQHGEKMNTTPSQIDQEFKPEQKIATMQTFDFLNPDIQTFSKLGTLQDEYQTQISSNKGLSNSMFPVTSEFMTNDQDTQQIRQKNKSKTELGQKQLQFLLQMQEQASKKSVQRSSFNQFDRSLKKPKTFVENGHVDPFVKMFHKRLKYNFFQQYGKVDLQNLKSHVRNDATKQLPDIDHNIPSLTDIRLLMEEYLNYKNEQEIKKINQKYIQQSSDIKKNSSIQSQFNEKQSNEEVSSLKQNAFTQRSSKDISNQLNQFIQQPNLQEDTLTAKVSQKDLKLIQDQYYSSEQNKQEIKQHHQKQHSLTTSNFQNNNEAKNKINQLENQKLEDVLQQKNSLDPLKSQKTKNQSPESRQKQIDFQKKLGYLKYITSDHKLDRKNNKQFINLGQTTSINIKSLNKLSLTDKRSSESDINLGLFTARPSLPKQIKSFSNLSGFSSKNKDILSHINPKIESKNFKSYKQEYTQDLKGQLSARQFDQNSSQKKYNLIIMSQEFQNNQGTENPISPQQQQQIQLEDSKKKRQRIIIV
ncbi:cyclic nucleotide-binding domain protein (macronuclear) [Tetrahymena thermophila SB210]|uniref:Cyclic nucleotide-binding domain protein n=1 Tax=Tetrahymena thermophila (strain SB210) TaxID=312017 RepID=I7MMA4_TETTS|nr:cyclic nucleotide-binding domain protein [Tetrahymena thermophila SB210]EAS04462.2 cyclic nucleotide-binding domain protein [Tetrahymena thermophila SB210]|eukprot:XP_001024707.2 cyclic nucleotide-binding domain protein [Tetrahymena thermophila SB210]